MSSATTRPRRITTMRSTTWKTWWMLWAMKMQECPEFRAPRTKFNTPCVSATPRLLVGSSRMMRSLSKCIARAIATACRSPPDSEEIGVSGGICFSIPTLRRSPLATPFIVSVSSRPSQRGPFTGSRPRKRFRAIESCVTSAESW